MNKFNLAVSNRLRSACLQHEHAPNVARVEGYRLSKTCLDHWNLEFGYYLLFVIWCLEFFKFKDPNFLKYSARLFYYICGTQHYYMASSFLE